MMDRLLFFPLKIKYKLDTLDEFVIQAIRCIVGYVTAKQTHAKHMSHVEAVSVAMEYILVLARIS